MSNIKAPFTFEQLMAYRAYEEVRRRGLFNMFDPNARLSTGLSREDYMFVMKNYDQLREIEEGGDD